ncbi:MAG: Maf family protein [Lentisphaeria bacterium]|nr:Maf family protein [Lentisphaeria bacterium]
MILASGSSRRLQILQSLGVQPKVIIANVDETPYANENPSEYVLRLAIEKSSVVSSDYPAEWVLGSDTIVALPDNKKLGKPENLTKAFKMLKNLSGKCHHVFTGVCLKKLETNQNFSFVEKSTVYFKKLSNEEIIEYHKRINPLDKAGAYAIQEHGELVVDRYEGEYYNIVGLPINQLKLLLNQLQIS